MLGERQIDNDNVLMQVYMLFEDDARHNGASLFLWTLSIFVKRCIIFKMAASMPALPPNLKGLQHYIKTASEHDKRDPVVAYYCKFIFVIFLWTFTQLTASYTRLPSQVPIVYYLLLEKFQVNII